VCLALADVVITRPDADGRRARKEGSTKGGLVGKVASHARKLEPFEEGRG